MFDVESWLNNSTNVRSGVPPAIETAWRGLQVVSPALAAAVAVRWFMRPIRGATSAEAQAFLASAQHSTLPVGNETAAAFSWIGEPGPNARHAFVIHGWAGRASQLRSLIRALSEEGFTVHALEAPGHGAARGANSSLLHFGHTLRAAEARWGAPHLLVAHSFGGGASTLAVSERWVNPGRMVLIAPNANPMAWTAGWLRALGANVRTAERFVVGVRNLVGAEWEAVDPKPRFAGLKLPGLVVHDRGDDEVSFAEGEAAAAEWPGARWMPTEGLGHRRILHDAAVIAAVLELANAATHQLSAAK